MYSVRASINNRYEIQSLIGKGTTGSVYKALDRLTGQIVALKQIHPSDRQFHFVEPEEKRKQELAIAREFRILASLRHPHIISVQDYGFDAEYQPFFTMEYLPQAHTLVEYGKDQLPEKQIDLFIQLIQALSYLHSCDVLHRDLKPENVMVVNGHVKVLDFGLAKHKDIRGDTGAIVGTVAYMAPEVIKGTPASIASDLYSVGVLAYQLYDGEYPFHSLMEILEKPPHISNLPISPELQNFIKQLLEKKPENRFPNADVALRELVQAAKFPFPTEIPAIQESFLNAAKFVGREDEFKQLTDALQKTNQGQGSAWLIGGESGVGKSRLMAELGTQALVEGVLLLQGQTTSEVGPLYQLWHPVLRRLCLEVELSDFEASILKTVIPDIPRLINRTVPDAPTIDPTIAQTRLLNVIEAIFSRQTQAIILLLSDLHWAQESLIILKMLSRLANRLPLLIVASYRDDERPELPELLPDMIQIKLRGLQRDAISQLSRSILGESEQHDHIVDLLVHETEGNAFFIVETIRALAKQAGHLRLISQAPLPTTLFPEGMKASIQRRLSYVPASARPLLYAAAISGRELDLDLLKTIDPQTNIPQWLTLVSSVISVQNNRYRFAHDKLRETLLEELDDSYQHQLHHDVADAIRTIYPNAPHYYQLLAGHYHMAGDAYHEAHYAALAAEQALNNGLFHEASLLLNRVLTLYNHLPVEPVQKANVISLLSAVCLGLGDIAGSRKAAEQALPLFGIPVPSTNSALRVDLLKEVSKQILIRLIGKKWISSQQLANHTNAQQISQLLLHLGYIYEFECEKYFALDNILKAINLVEIEEFESLQSVAYYFAAILYQTKPLSLLGLHKKYIAQAEEILKRTSYNNHYGHSLLVKSAYFSIQGDWEKSIQISNEAKIFFSERGSVREIDNIIGLQVNSEFLMGAWNNCYTHASFVYESASKRNDLQATLGSLVWMIAQHIRRGGWDQLPSVMEQTFYYLNQPHSHSMIIWSGSIMGLAHYHLGNIELAKQFAAPALEVTRQKMPISIWLHEPLAGLAELYLKLWQKGEIADLAPAKTAIHALMNMSNIYQVSQPCAYIWQGYYHYLVGQKRRAKKAWQYALNLAQQYHTPYYEGLAHFYLASISKSDEREQHQIKAELILDRLGAIFPEKLITN